MEAWQKTVLDLQLEGKGVDQCAKEVGRPGFEVLKFVMSKDVQRELMERRSVAAAKELTDGR